MKKKYWLLGIVSSIIVVFGIIYLRSDRVDMAFVKDADICFVYGDIDEIYSLEDSELNTLIDIFDGKKMHMDNPSCGFNEDISIKFNGEQTFCIARDACPIVYWKEANRYIMISEEEKGQLYGLFEAHGFFFPCI